MSYTYFPTGKVETIASSNPGGASVSYTYDELNRLSTVVDNRLQGSNTTTYTYDSASNLVTAAYPNGLTSAFTYDALNRLTELATSEPSGPPVADYKYTAWPRSHSPFPNQLRVPPVPRFWGPVRGCSLMAGAPGPMSNK